MAFKHIVTGKPNAPIIIVLPQQVLNLTATAVSQSTINLGWSAIAGISQYNIYRGGIFLFTVSTSFYSDVGLTASTLYSYTVSAVNAFGEGPQSASASATTFANATTIGFPKIWQQATGGNQNYTQAWGQYASLMDGVCIGRNLEGSTASSGMYLGSRQACMNYVKSLTPTTIATKIGQYYITDNVDFSVTGAINNDRAPTMTSYIQNNNWFLWNAVKVVTAATNANPVKLTIAAHGLTNGQTVSTWGFSGGTFAANLNSTIYINHTYVVTVVDANNISIPVNSTAFGTFSGGYVCQGNVGTTTNPQVPIPNPFKPTAFYYTNQMDYTQVDGASGLHLEKRFAKYVVDEFFNGTLHPANSASAMDGTWRDNNITKVTTSGDYQQIGSPQASLSGNNTTLNTALISAVKSAYDYLKIYNAGKLTLGNFGGWGYAGSSNSGTNAPDLAAKMDGGMIETALGKSYATESFAGFSGLKGQINWLVTNAGTESALGARYVYLGHNDVAADGSDLFNGPQSGPFTASAPYQAQRYSLGIALLGGIPVTHAAVGYVFSDLRWFDEYSVDPITANAIPLTLASLPTSTAALNTVAAGRKYLGQPLDAIWGQVIQGCYLRRYFNSATNKTWLIIVNPRGNPAQTINVSTLYSNLQFKRILGTQAPSVNDGSTSATVTVPTRDAIIGQLVTAPGTFNPPYPRLSATINGNAGTGRSYISGNGLVKCPQANCYLLLQTWSGWRDSVNSALNFGQVVAQMKINNPNQKLLAYMNTGEIVKSHTDGVNTVTPPAAGTASTSLTVPAGVDYDSGINIQGNKRNAFTNGLTAVVAIASAGTDQRGNSWFGYANGTSTFWKLNYTTAAVADVNGKKWYQWLVDRNYQVYKLGQSTASNGSGGLNTNGGVTTQIDGFFLDNFFMCERPRPGSGNGQQLDYNRDGVVDVNEAPASYNLIRASNRATADYIRSVYPGAIVVGNITDWNAADNVGGTYGSLDGGPYDQALDGGLLEAIIGLEPGNQESYSNMKFMMQAYAQAIRLCRIPALVNIGINCTTTTDYTTARYGMAFACLNNGSSSANNGGGTSQGYNVNEWIVLDEFKFPFGNPLSTGYGLVSTTAAYSYNATTGEGVWRRDYDNCVALCAARRGTGGTPLGGDLTPYTSFTLPFDTWRLRASAYSNQDPVVNSGAKIPAGTAITMSPRTGLILSKSVT